MKTTAVIGANFGDEGKGRLVDQLVSKSNGSVIVVRYNGGAQAGHTVVCPDGKRHSFSHFGSGSFLGASTYLGERFIGNPILYIKELKELQDLGIKPKLFTHRYMPLSTPYDMILNRELEIWRGNNRHGSCGYGIAETVERLCNTSYKTFFADAVKNKNKFEKLIQQIRTKYVPQRLKSCGIKIPTDSFTKAVNSDKLLLLYYRALTAMTQEISVKKTSFLKKFNNVIFEGSQGLGLDERHKFFPHVTRSKTGIDNIENICKRIGVDEIDVIYVTRAYLTRHGAGPMPTENEYLYYNDETNIENEWQGKLRFGFLDIDLMAENLKNDSQNTKLRTNKSIAITCLDQVPDNLKVKYDGKLQEIDKKHLPDVIKNLTGISKIMISRSPKRKD